MIQGNKKDIEKILPFLSAGLQKALTYIAATDFSVLANGEYEIDGRAVFARVNTYETEPMEQRRPEKHNQYIDVQFIAAGSETVWYTPLTPACAEIENRAEEDDVIFYASAGEKNCAVMNAGDFAIFFPWELHRPNCACGAPCHVQKIVVKVKA